jgi:hypothetical protein
VATERPEGRKSRGQVVVGGNGAHLLAVAQQAATRAHRCAYLAEVAAVIGDQTTAAAWQELQSRHLRILREVGRG